MKLKVFFIIFGGLSMKQITHFFLEGESPNLINCRSCEISKKAFRKNNSGGCFWHFRVNLQAIVLELLARNRPNI